MVSLCYIGRSVCTVNVELYVKAVFSEETEEKVFMVGPCIT